MKKLLLVSLSASVGFLLAIVLLGLPLPVRAGGGQGGGGAEKCAAKNGDVNADGRVDLSDAVTILNFLFLGSPTELAPLCAPPPALAGLPDTGQTQCYDCTGQPTPCLDCTGRPRPCEGFTEDFLRLQDSFQRTGCPYDAARFTDNVDGTVTDNCTGLMWQKNTADVNGDGLIGANDRLNWCAALSYCANLDLAGHSEWRLPNVRELQSIVNYGRCHPSIDPVFGAAPNTYWSSTSIAVSPGSAWEIHFSDGCIDSLAKGAGGIDGALVRAVRTAP